MDADQKNHLPLLAPCANCGAPLAGRFCSSCGQRADTHAHSLGHFLSEATEVLTHADSRVWGTIWPLLSRPGFLTREYFAGRRARYLQPFRLYLIMSVVFFVLSALLGGGRASDSDTRADNPVRAQDCIDVKSDLHWGSYKPLPQIKAACRSIRADNGREFGERVVHNLGRALFMFLPLLAALMKLLYWRPRRYYLEHLLLLIHDHAFVFLLLSIFMLATHWMKSGSGYDLLFFIVTWYLVRYLYRSMKTVYGQSGLRTSLKFVVLGFAYLLGGAFMLLATAFYSAATL